MTQISDLEQPSAQVDTLLERSLKDIGIPPRPVLLDRISSEMCRDDPDYKRMAHTISSDVGLAASLIKTANSSYFGTRGRVRSVNEALMMMGLKVSSKAIAGIILRKAFPNSFQLERFWDASALIAHLSGWLVQRLDRNKLRSDDAYTFGLFRDCGIPVLLMRFPVYEETLAKANNEETRSFTAIEDLELPTNHAMIGCMLAQSWGLSEETYLAIRCHHNATATKTSIALPLASHDYIAISQLAEYLVQLHSGLSQTHEWQKLGQTCLTVLDITEEDLNDVITESVAIIKSAD